jgi:hypothetical protein
MSKKTIKINAEYLKTPSGNEISTNKTLKNKPIKEKPKIIIKPNNIKKQLLQKIKNYQNKDDESITTTNDLFESSAIEKKEKDIIDFKDNDFNNEFNKSLNFLQDLSLQNKNTNSQNNNNNIKKPKNKTLKKPNNNKNNNNSFQAQVATELPPELYSNKPTAPKMQEQQPYVQQPQPPPPPYAYAEQEPIINITTIKESPSYGNLKNGIKPTYRQFHNKTQKIKNIVVNENNNSSTNAVVPTPQSTSASIAGAAPQSASTSVAAPQSASTSVAAAPQSASTSIAGAAPQSASTSIAGAAPQSASITAAPQKIEPESTLPEANENANEVVLDEFIRKKITRTSKYKLGKRGNRVSILIKNGKTRKLVQYEHALLKKKSILDVKNYLRKKNLLKIGSEAPPDILRQIYESSILSGDLENKSKETLIHNYMNDK